MSSVNRVILIGRLGGDPEIKHLPSGDASATFSVATSEKWKDRETGEQREKSEWHNIKMFGKLAEIAGQYLKKGAQVYLEGQITTETWEKEGVKHYKTVIKCNSMTMLGSKDAGGNQSAPQAAPQARPTAAPQQHTHNHDGFNDDIPFN
jgi:single-strand DNA-binding protein